MNNTHDHASAHAAPSTRALWYVSRGNAEVRTQSLSAASDGEIVVQTVFTGVSKGTEGLICSGGVPVNQHNVMCCPHQEGGFDFPVKYGYALVGVVLEGPKQDLGRTVFALHPHQEHAVLAACAAIPVPDGVPARRAILAANMETALNAVWDSEVRLGDRVVVVGGGLVGLLIVRLLTRMAGVEVVLCDLDSAKAEVAAQFGAAFVSPDDVPGDQDVVFHASASEAGLRTAIACAGLEARVVEVSWHGAHEVRLALGENFHSRRLSIVSSQVGQLPLAQAGRWTHRRRLIKAMSLLDDGALDALITHEIAFDDAPGQLPGLLKPDSGALAIALRYGDTG